MTRAEFENRIQKIYIEKEKYEAVILTGRNDLEKVRLLYRKNRGYRNEEWEHLIQVYEDCIQQAVKDISISLDCIERTAGELAKIKDWQFPHLEKTLKDLERSVAMFSYDLVKQRMNFKEMLSSADEVASLLLIEHQD